MLARWLSSGCDTGDRQRRGARPRRRSAGSRRRRRAARRGSRRGSGRELGDATRVRSLGSCRDVRPGGAADQRVGHLADLGEVEAGVGDQHARHLGDRVVLRGQAIEQVGAALRGWRRCNHCRWASSSAAASSFGVLLGELALELGGAGPGRVGGERRLGGPRRRLAGRRAARRSMAARANMARRTGVRNCVGTCGLSALRTDLEHLIEAAVDLAEEVAQGPVLGGVKRDLRYSMWVVTWARRPCARRAG
jgi:hypothetical protein